MPNNSDNKTNKAPAKSASTRRKNNGLVLVRDEKRPRPLQSLMSQSKFAEQMREYTLGLENQIADILKS